MKKPCILYLDTIPGDRIQAAKFVGVQRYAAARTWEAYAVRREESRIGDLPALLASRRPQGCVVQCHIGSSPLPPSIFGFVPVAYLDVGPAFESPGAARVVADDCAVARIAMHELAAARPAAFAFVGWRNRQPWCVFREEVFRDEAGKSGLPSFVFDGILRRGYGECSRAAHLAEWLSELPRHTAVFAANDVVAGEVFTAAAAAKLGIPRDITVVGADGSPDLPKSEGPALTTVRIDHERSGWRAAKAAAEGSKGIVTYGPLMVVRRKSTGGRGRHEPFVSQAVEIIRRSACDGLTPESLVTRFRCSRRLFEMRFREATGHSVLDEIHHVRLEKACLMLAHGDAPVAAVADMCGFGSYDALHALFRLAFGKTPSAYRALHRS